MITLAPGIDQLTQKDIWNLAVEHDIISTYFDDWHLYGQAQNDLLRKFIDPAGKTILDIGCGAARLGSYILRDAELYVGVDPFKPYLNMARDLMTKLGYSQRARLIHSERFEFPPDIQFDFAWSQSVFTHISEEQIELCLNNLLNVMKPGSTLVFTYIVTRQPQAHHEGRFYQQRMPVICSYLAGTGLFERFAKRHGFSFIPEVDRSIIPAPIGQKVGVLTF